MKTTKRDIVKGLGAIKRAAKRCFHKGDDESAMRFIDAYSSIAGQFNLNYSDDDVEGLLRIIAEKEIQRSKGFSSDSSKWILYDDFCTTYVLGLQWLHALAKSGRQILYITTRDTNAESRHKNILDRVSEYENVEIRIIPQGERFERAQSLYDSIVQSGAAKIILHKYPTSSPIDLVLPVLPAQLEKYLINLSDQTFWLGARFIDYCLEFRQFGASVSLQRRGLQKGQLLMVPFYPADDGNEFGGFPIECSKEKVIVFSGGDYYKTLDDDRTYWALVREVLNKYPQVVFLFATKNIPEGDSEIKSFISDNHFDNRFIYIQFRPDIFQVFSHCDIFMGTCPTSGSLMSQLAAINGKPILQYYAPGTPDDETEQAICINEQFPISYLDKEGFMQEADRLINDPDYRSRKGNRLKTAMMQPSQFDQIVCETLDSNKTQLPIEAYPIDYTSLDDRWFYLEKEGYISTIPFIYSLLGWRYCLWATPAIFVKKNVNRFLHSCKR